MRTFFSFESPAMRRVRFSLLIGLLAASMILLGGCDSNGGNGSDADDGTDNGSSSSTVTELTVNTNNLSTLESAVKAADLASTLGDENNTYTVFAPVNSAFNDIEVGDLTGDDALLNKVLTYHVVSGQEITSGDISDGETQTVETLQGADLTISQNGGTVTVNGATVTTADVQASNGVVHLIDGVLLQNTNVVERASITPDFNILTKLVEKAGLTSTLSGSGPFTIFAPTDQAFLNKLDDDGDGVVQDDEIPPNAQTILEYHAVTGNVYYADDEPIASSSTKIPSGQTNAGTAEGSDVTIDRSSSGIAIDPNDENASVGTPDVDVSNGIIHGIDKVLSP